MPHYLLALFLLFSCLACESDSSELSHYSSIATTENTKRLDVKAYQDNKPTDKTYTESEKLENYVHEHFATKGLGFDEGDIESYSRDGREHLRAYRLNDNYWVCRQKISHHAVETEVNGTRLFLFDNNLNIKDEDFVGGCHYHVGDIRIEDWDKDGKMEVVHFINYVEQDADAANYDLYTIFELQNEQLVAVFEHKDSASICSDAEKSCTFETVQIKKQPLQLDINTKIATKKAGKVLKEKNQNTRYIRKNDSAIFEKK